MKTALSMMLLAVAAGCGTTSNLLQTPPAFYGGVTKDFEAYREYTAHDAPDLAGDLMWSTFLVADVPLSMLADTLTLPYVWYQSTSRPPAERFPITPASRERQRPE